MTQPPTQSELIERHRRAQRAVVGRDLSLPDVRAAVAQVMEEKGDADAGQVQWAAAKVLGLQNPDYPDGPITLHTRFVGQVRSALDALAADNTIIKVGKGQTTAWGTTQRNMPHYWTPVAYAKAAQEAQERQHRAVMLSDRQVAVKRRLEALGLEPHRADVFSDQCPKGEIWVDTDTWERILSKLPGPLGFIL